MNEAKATKLGYQTIHDFARKIDEESGIRNIFNIKEIISSMGGNIKQAQNMKDNKIPFIIIDGKNKFEISLPIGANEELERLLLSQALGHYILHSQSGQEPCQVSSIANSETSQEGFWFALSLLIPDKFFVSLYKDRSENSNFLTEMANLFRLPEFSIESKIKILKKLTLI